MTQDAASKTITFEQLGEFREKTERLSQFLTQRLKTHIATLSQNLAPRRVFGRYLGSKETVVKADDAYNQLTQKYKEVCGSPFDLRSDLDDEALGGMDTGIEVYPWTYPHTAGGKVLTITSPVRWVLTYRSEYSLSEMRALLSGKGDRPPLPMRRFVVNALSMQLVMARNAATVQLLDDLRYEVRTETAPGLGKLPLVTISSRIPSFRPSDDLILMAARFSGVPAFIELINPESISQLQDPFRTKLESLLA